MSASPWEILSYRKLIKNYQKTGVSETMKILKKVRDMNLNKEIDSKMIAYTEFTKSLLYISNRLKQK